MKSTSDRTGRTARVLAFIRTNPTGVTVRQLIDATEPDCPSSLMWGCINHLVDARRIIKHHNGRSVEFLLAPDKKAAPPATVPPPAPAPSMRIQLRTCAKDSIPSSHTAVHAKSHAAAQLAADVAAHIASNGTFIRLAPGESSQSIRQREEHVRLRYGRVAEVKPNRRKKSA